MQRGFIRIPLPLKLMLIGIVPLIFFVYLAIQLYNERTQKVKLLGDYINRMHRSADISKLINNLQLERKYSFDFSVNKTMRDELIRQRPKTDSFLNRMGAYDESLADFISYTFLDQLSRVRKAVDSGSLQPGFVIDYYSSTIFRLNTLNQLPTGSYVYMRPVYKDMISQKLLSEMLTFLGIISANIYNALYTRKYMVEILMGTGGTYRVYNSYEKEFLLKSSPVTAEEYKSLRKIEPVYATSNYIDTLFTKFSFDSSYTHTEWERASTMAIGELRNLQQRLLKKVETKTGTIYDNEKVAGRRTLVFILFSLAFVSATVLYTIHAITKTLNHLKEAAQRISLGARGQLNTVMSNDVIGNLAHSISAIDTNNQQLADAAHAIGKGQFDVPVYPRSINDLLGNAIVDMKSSLQKSTSELTASNTELERFAYVASHDLQEPLRMVSSFLNLLEEEYKKNLDERAREYIHFAVDGAARMKILVNDLLQYSRVGTNKEAYTITDLNETMEYVSRVLQEEIIKNKVKLTVQPMPVIRANKTLMSQLFMNLIGNAVKYMGERSPEIEVGMRDTEEWHVLYVKDNGIGIDTKFFDKIFIIFQRLHSKAEYSGTGIGLAICKKIAEVHKGKLWVESVKGEGSTFYFSIPKKI